MSRHPRGAGPRHGASDPDPIHGVVAGWGATEADLPELRRQTHDTLVALMGATRVGAVSWRTYRGTGAAGVIQGLAATGDDPAWVAAYRRMGELLAAHGGYVVVASAPAAPGTPEAVMGRG